MSFRIAAADTAADSLEWATVLPAYPADRRRVRRFPTSQPILLGVAGEFVTVDLVDLSELGARVHIANGFVPLAGHTIALTFLNGTELVGSVKWVGQTHLGISFKRSLPEVEDYLAFDDMGHRLFQCLARLQMKK